jgi:hypothetical protein
MPEGAAEFRYFYGEMDGNPGSEEEALRAIANALPSEETGPHVIDVFAEDTPRDLEKAERVVARLKKIGKKLEKETPEASRIEIEIIPVPKELARQAALEPELSTIAEEFRRAISRPTAFDVRNGVIIGAYRGVASFSTWFATPGINPLLATGIATFQTALSAFHSTFSRSMANVFKINLVHPGGKPIRAGTLFIRRQAYGLLLAELTRLIVGTPPGYSSQFSLEGQAQIVTLSLIFSGLDSVVMNVRDTAFLKSPRHFARMVLANFFVLTPWALLDTAGTFPVLLDLTIYKVRASTFGMLATYASIYASIRYAPGKTAKLLDAVFDPIDRIAGKIQRRFGRCDDLLKGEPAFKSSID